MLTLGENQRDIASNLMGVCFESLSRGKFGAIDGEYLISASSCKNIEIAGDYRISASQKQTLGDVLLPKCGDYYEIWPSWTNRRIYGRIAERHLVADAGWQEKTNIYQGSELYWSDTRTPLDAITNNFLAISTVGSTFDFFGEIFEAVSQPIFDEQGFCSFNYTRTRIPGIHIFSIPYRRITG